ncbi:AAA family ATPase [Thiohalobacter sp.]|uniref:AAA family ATPase n=1 Tax=Thiohalobacter sp. TaxID=2025948 RepID=UPI0026062F69|nr:AAA family ATPase [Thiohalobacter sp.]
MNDSGDNGYQAALGLAQEPFAEGVADAFFYADPALMQRLDLLAHLTQFSDQLLLIHAPQGAGKTTLARQFRLRAPESWLVCMLSGNELASTDDVRQRLAACLGLDAELDADELALQALRRGEALQQDGRLAVLVIDDAQAMSDEAVQALLGLGESPRQTVQALRMLLFAEPGLDQRLLKLGLNPARDPLVHRLDIAPFDAQQSAAYLMYRLAIAGYSGDSPFSATEVRAMHKRAEGRPGALNRLARQTLDERAQRVTAMPGTPAGRVQKRRWLLGGSALALALVVAWTLFSSGSDEGEPPLVELTLPPPAAQAPSGTATPAPPETVAETGPTQEEAPAAAEATAAPGPPVATETVAPRQASGTVAGEQPPPNKAPHAAEPDTAPALSAQATTPRPEASASAPASEPPEATAEASPAPGKPSPPPTTPPEDPFLAWVKAQPADHWTLQLLGVREATSAQAFLRRHGLADDPRTGVLHSRYKGGDWYVAIHGSFPDRAAARAAIARLPAAVRKGQPWPRRMGEVQAAIAAD